MGGGFFTPGRMMKFGIALIFDLIKFIFSLAFLFAPLIAGVVLGAVAQSKCNGILPDWTPAKGWVCTASGAVVGSAVTTFGYIAEGAGGFIPVEAAGEVLADAIDIMAWCCFFIIFAMTGVRFFGTMRSTRRFFLATAGASGGLIPFVNVGPTITIAVIGIEYQQWLEDKATTAVAQVTQTKRMRLIAQQEAFAQARERAAQWNVQAALRKQQENAARSEPEAA